MSVYIYFILQSRVIVPIFDCRKVCSILKALMEMPTCPLRKIKKKAKLNPKKKKPRQMPSTTRKSPSSIAFHAKLPKSPKLDHDPEMTATQNLNSTKKHLAWPDIVEKDVAITTIVEDTTMVEAIAAMARISTVEVEVEESTAVTEEEDSTAVEVIKNYPICIRL